MFFFFFELVVVRNEFRYGFISGKWRFVQNIALSTKFRQNFIFEFVDIESKWELYFIFKNRAMVEQKLEGSFMRYWRFKNNNKIVFVTICRKFHLHPKSLCLLWIITNRIMILLNSLTKQFRNEFQSNYNVQYVNEPWNGLRWKQELDFPFSMFSPDFIRLWI